MGFKDILKKSFVEGFTNTEITATYIIFVLLVTCLISAYIFGVYRIVTRKTFYNKNFNISLAALAVITAAIILTIQSSVVVSLGMVGALSIVRFRTAVKDPMDLVFLFWSISVGIICGAGMAETAVLASLIVTIVIFILDRLPVVRAPMILVINAGRIDCEAEVLEIVKSYSRYYSVKSRNMTDTRLDLIVEVRVSEEAALVRGVKAVGGIHEVSLLSHDGEVTY